MRTIILAATIEFGRIHSASAHLPSVPQIDYLFQCIRRALKHILLKFKRPTNPTGTVHRAISHFASECSVRLPAN